MFEVKPVRKIRPALIGAALAATALLAACSSGTAGTSNVSSAISSTAGSSSAAPSDLGPVVIAAYNFGESKILAAMYAAVLQKAGYSATVKELTNREVIEPALEKGGKNGGVDIVPEYIGTLTEFLNKKQNGTNATVLASGDPAKTLTALQTLAAKVGIVVYAYSPAADQNAFAVSKDFATKNNLTTLSDLGKYKGDLVLGGPAECPTRPFCEPGLKSIYGITFSGFQSLDAGGPLTKQALKQNKIQIGLVFSSDGGVAANNLVVLTDDKQLQTADNIAPAVNKLAASDAMKAALDGLSKVLTTNDLIALNKQVDIDRADPATVAASWLGSKGLG